MKVAMLASANNRHTWRWCSWLSGQGHAITLFSDVDPRDDMNYGGVELVQPHWTMLQNFSTFKLRPHPYANNRDKWRVYENKIRAFAPDLIHAQEALGYGPMLKHFPQFPRVLTPWGPEIESLSSPQPGDPLRRALIMDGIEAADVITTNAPGNEDHWHHLTNAREKFHFFSWGVDTSIFFARSPQEQQAIRNRLKLSTQRVFLSPRLAKPLYGIDIIIEAWNAAKLDALLVILRAGTGEEEWKNLHDLSADNQTIRLVDDYLPPDEMSALYSAAHATIMIPQTDLLAISLLETIACGSIPVVSELPCYRTAVVDLQDAAVQRAKGLYLQQRHAKALQEALARAGNISDDERQQIASHNIDYIHAHQRWQDRATSMIDSYDRALDAFSRRRA